VRGLWAQGAGAEKGDDVRISVRAPGARTKIGLGLKPHICDDGGLLIIFSGRSLFFERYKPRANFETPVSHYAYPPAVEEGLLLIFPHISLTRLQKGLKCVNTLTC